jgi:hypothetical protein
MDNTTLSDHERLKQLKDIFDTLTDGMLFDLRYAEFLMQSSGGLEQPDVVNFIGRKYVGKTEAIDKALWGYIDGLPAYFKHAVSPYFGRLKDVYVPAVQIEPSEL